MIRGMTALLFIIDLGAEKGGKYRKNRRSFRIGCVIVLDYEVIATARATDAKRPRYPTAQAEILALRQGGDTIGNPNGLVRLRSLCEPGSRLYDVRGCDPRSADHGGCIKAPPIQGGSVESGVRFFTSPTCPSRSGGEVYSAVGQRAMRRPIAGVVSMCGVVFDLHLSACGERCRAAKRGGCGQSLSLDHRLFSETPPTPPASP